ncbi:MAG: catalase [Gammaproteobacteria bacterium]|nr:catalase [Gammaproteobacteria bacterium]
MKHFKLVITAVLLFVAQASFATVDQAELRSTLDALYVQDKVASINDGDLFIRQDLGESWLHGSKEAELAVVRDIINQLGKLQLGKFVVDDSPSLVTNIRDEVLSGRQDYYILRDAHPKAHQCVNASFTVENNDFFPIGSFLGDSNIQHDAIVRFSSSNPDPSSDTVHTVRGAAIKVLMGDQTHDFVMQSAANFPTDDLEQFSNLIKVGRTRNCLSIIADPGHDSILGPALDFIYQLQQATQCLIESDFNLLDLPETVRAIMRFRQGFEDSEIKSVFDFDYFSVTPYAYENIVFKYEISPATCPEPNSENRSFTAEEAADSEGLENNIQRVLSGGAACYDLNVVARPTDISDEQAIEFLIETWDQKSSQVLERIKVASVVIPMLTLGADITSLTCDEMSYNNGRNADGFKPLGSINRGRIPIYDRLSAFRLEANEHLRHMNQ